MAPQPPQTLPRIGSAGHWLAWIVFLLGAGGAAYLWWQAAQSQVQAAVPAHPLAAYYQIRKEDLELRLFPAGAVPANAIVDAASLLGRYTLTEMAQSQPLTADQLGPVVNAALLSGKVVVAIPAPPAAASTDHLKAGDVVDIILARAPSGSAAASAVSFENVLVLDVRQNPNTIRAAADAAPASALVLALPIERRLEFAEKSAGAVVTIMLRR